MRTAVKKSGRPERIFIAMPIGTASQRRMLVGILNYVELHTRWSISIPGFTGPTSAEDIDAMRSDGVTGLITAQLSDEKAYRRLADTGMCAVVLNPPQQLPNTDLAHVRFIDSVHSGRFVGESAANFLTGLGDFRHFGYVPVQSNTRNLLRPWSSHRCNGFTDRLDKLRKPYSVFQGDNLSEWLQSLPKPAAIFAAFDMRALDVLNAAHKAGISVPGSISVLGVDNDELLCEHASPPLSSIRLPHEELGFAIAAKLQALFRQTKAARGNIVLSIKAIEVVERQSTRSPVPAADLIRRALTYIRHNAANDISATDIAKHLGVSRSLLYRRFKELHGETLHQAILRFRLDRVQRLLTTTDLSIEEIAAEANFSDRRVLSRQFRQVFGHTPSEHRRAQESV